MNHNDTPKPNYTIVAPGPKAVDDIIDLVALAQGQPRSAVDRSIYQRLCGMGGSMALPGIGTVGTGRIAIDEDGSVVGFIYATFPMHYLMPLLRVEVDLFGLVAAVTEINVLAVAPRHQRRGIGTGLLEHIAARAAREGRQVALVTSPNPKSTEWWSGQGFLIGQCALKIGDLSKMPMRPGWHAAGARPLNEGCDVTRTGRTITVNWKEPTP